MIDINLLPWREALREREKKQFLVMLGVTVACAVVLIFLMHMVIRSRVVAQQSRNLYLQERLDHLEDELIALENAEREKQHLDARFQLMKNLLHNRYRLVRLLDELTKILPEHVYLNGISKKGGIARIQGRALTNDAVTQLMKRVETSEWLEEPTLDQIKTDKAGGKDFTLTFRQKGEVSDIPAPVKKRGRGVV